MNEKLINEQDSVITKLSLPFLFKAKRDLDKSEFQWNLWLKSLDETPSNILFNSFARMPESVFNPTFTEVVQHEINMIKGLSIPTVFNFSPSGISIDLQKAGTFLGVVEDVSPVISYTLYEISDVEIVIYSIGAKAVATIFSGTQRAGSYSITWNLKDDLGKRMPPGDYVGEVKIGSKRYVMKRIVIK
jgi:hypothetical protein